MELGWVSRISLFHSPVVVFMVENSWIQILTLTLLAMWTWTSLLTSLGLFPSSVTWGWQPVVPPTWQGWAYSSNWSRDYQSCRFNEYTSFFIKKNRHANWFLVGRTKRASGLFLVTGNLVSSHRKWDSGECCHVS